jgi:hypothetical protein
MTLAGCGGAAEGRAGTSCREVVEEGLEIRPHGAPIVG